MWPARCAQALIVLASFRTCADAVVAQSAAPASAVPIEEALTAPEGFVAHLRGLERTHVFAVVTNGKPVAIDAIVDQFENVHLADAAVHKRGATQRVSLATAEAASRGPSTPAASSSAGAESILAPAAAGSCPPATSVCATFRQAGDETFVLAQNYPKRFAADPAKPRALWTASLTRLGSGGLRKDAGGNCLEDVTDPGDGSSHRTPVACPGTKIAFAMPGCVAQCAPQRATFALRADQIFDSYETSPDCADFQISVTPEPSIGKTHALTFEIAHPNVRRDNVPMLCTIAVEARGPANAAP